MDCYRSPFTPFLPNGHFGYPSGHSTNPICVSFSGQHGFAYPVHVPGLNPTHAAFYGPFYRNGYPGHIPLVQVAFNPMHVPAFGFNGYTRYPEPNSLNQCVINPINPSLSYAQGWGYSSLPGQIQQPDPNGGYYLMQYKDLEPNLDRQIDVATATFTGAFRVEGQDINRKLWNVIDVLDQVMDHQERHPLNPLQKNKVLQLISAASQCSAEIPDLLDRLNRYRCLIV